jgi:hypothetical protein
MYPRIGLLERVRANLEETIWIPLATKLVASPSAANVRSLRRRSMLVYEDSFGFWDIGGQEEQAYYVQCQGVLVACERCERPVRLIPPKPLCASYVSALECGAPASIKEYGSQEALLDPTRPS